MPGSDATRQMGACKSCCPAFDTWLHELSSSQLATKPGELQKTTEVLGRGAIAECMMRARTIDQ